MANFVAFLRSSRSNAKPEAVCLFPSGTSIGTPRTSAPFLAHSMQGITLEAVSQMPQQDQQAAELDHAQEVGGVMFAARG